MLELKNICFSADGKQILKDINLRIDDAKFIVITGPNGSGKSTLARIISGILTPTAVRFSLTARISQPSALQSVQERASALPFSSLFVSRVLP